MSFVYFRKTVSTPKSSHHVSFFDLQTHTNLSNVFMPILLSQPRPSQPHIRFLIFVIFHFRGVFCVITASIIYVLEFWERGICHSNTGEWSLSADRVLGGSFLSFFELRVVFSLSLRHNYFSCCFLAFVVHHDKLGKRVIIFAVCCYIPAYCNIHN